MKKFINNILTGITICFIICIMTLVVFFLFGITVGFLGSIMGRGVETGMKMLGG